MTNHQTQIKVAYFIGSLNRGGTESLTLDICRQHQNVPYDFICVYRHNGNMSEEYHASGAKVEQVRKGRGMLRYLWHLRQFFLRNKITIVHSQTPSNTLLLFAALCGTNIKVVTTSHGFAFANAPWWQRKIVYTLSKKVLCVSEQQKQFYEQKWNLPMQNKLRVVYNGIDFSKIDSAAPSIEFTQTPTRIRLAMVGNFVSIRSQDIVVKSIHRLQEQGITDFDFYFIGRRESKQAWRYDNCVDYCKEHGLTNVHFLGSRGDVPSLLKAMDGFVYSTAHDTFGIAVIEAIAARLPVIVNDWPVMTEVCSLGLPSENNAVRFFKTEDVDDCATQVKSLLDDLTNKKEQLNTDCRLASDAVRERYSIQTHIKELYSIYQTLT